jgi:hypothetical protein
MGVLLAGVAALTYFMPRAGLATGTGTGTGVGVSAGAGGGTSAGQRAVPAGER